MKNYFVEDVLHYCNVSLDKHSAMSEHKINFYDLTFMLKGNMTYIANGKSHVLNPNDAILLKPGTLRSRLPGTDSVEYVSFNFTLLPNTALNLNEYIPKCITNNIKNLVSAFPNSHLSPYRHAKEKVTNMLNYILFELYDTCLINLSNEHVLKIINYIEEHITEKMSLQCISEKIGLTKEYTAFIFKKETGRTLTDYINERKMLIAEDLILCNTMRLSDISNYLGYDNYNYFSRLFKRYYNTSPIELKRKQNNI